MEGTALMQGVSQCLETLKERKLPCILKHPVKRLLQDSNKPQASSRRVKLSTEERQNQANCVLILPSKWTPWPQHWLQWWQQKHWPRAGLVTRTVCQCCGLDSDSLMECIHSGCFVLPFAPTGSSVIIVMPICKSKQVPKFLGTNKEKSQSLKMKKTLDFPQLKKRGNFWTNFLKCQVKKSLNYTLS